MFNTIRKFLTAILVSIFQRIAIALKRLTFVGKGPETPIPIEDRLHDFIEIFKSTRLYFLFNLLALFIFISLPQGQDVILIVIDDLSVGHFLPLLSLVVGLTVWSVISEFGARYQLYVADNSAFSLSGERVQYRKEIQKIVSILYLLLPVFIVFISTIVVSFNQILSWEWKYSWPSAAILLILFGLFAALSKFYLDKRFIKKLRKKNVWFKIKEDELSWAEKLFGIYNDLVFMIRKSGSFRNDTPDDDLKESYTLFLRTLSTLPNHKTVSNEKGIESFPRDYIKEEELAPLEFTEVIFKEHTYVVDDNYPRKLAWKEKKEGFLRWIYINKPTFYKSLHKQIHIVSISSIIILLAIAIEFPLSYKLIGSPALVCLSFGCWQGVYMGLLYIDSRFRRQIKFSVRWLLFFWVIIVSIYNCDKEVRTNKDVNDVDRLSLNSHFDQWSSRHLLLDSSKLLWVRDTTKTDSAVRKKEYPVFFINAEGGGLRTGAFTSMLLARLQDSFPEFKEHIYAFSTVSGGSVGVSFFNATAFLQPDTLTRAKNYYQEVTRKFLENDQLAPVLGKMFYGDILNLFWPLHIEKFDRAIALEKAWEHSYASVFNKPNDQNVFSSSFPANYQEKLTPAWFINTTEVETGLQCYLSNVKADSFLFADHRDLITNKIKGNINYSTAVNFSTRFPLFSPAAALYQDDDKTYHYVDGGYVENTGAKTMWEVLTSLHKKIADSSILPYVIQLEFGDSSKFQQTGFLNQISSIYHGIYNTRAGSSQTYTAMLEKEVKSLKGQFIRVPMSATLKEVPMSWVSRTRV